MEITNSIRKLVKSLGDSRHRNEQRMFVAEGEKCVTETLGAFKLKYLFATRRWIEENQGVAKRFGAVAATSDDISRMSQLKAPRPVIAVYEMPEETNRPELSNNQLVLALDRIQDPGNLGTIIRIADWFGIKTILASEDTVDRFNPKVVQATMGAIGRVSIIYCDLSSTLAELSESMPVYGTFLDGDDIYHTDLTGNGIIVMGNEGNGISDQVSSSVNRRLFIPPYPADASTVESLNVSMATAITVAEFRRRNSR